MSNSRLQRAAPSKVRFVLNPAANKFFWFKRGERAVIISARLQVVNCDQDERCGELMNQRGGTVCHP